MLYYISYLRDLGVLFFASKASVQRTRRATDQPAAAYVWGTDGSIKTCDHLTFTLDGSEDTNGTVIGNGDKDADGSLTEPFLQSWFEPVPYVGAFSTNDNWLRGWTEFDPQNAEY